MALLHPSTTVSRWWHGRFGARLLVELAVISALLLSYKYVRYLTRDAGQPAFDNARWVIDVERSMGLAVEGTMQDLALQSHTLIGFVNRYYVASHFAVTVGVCLWVYLRRPAVYTRIRWVLVGLTLAALAIHVAFPLAPPRMMSGSGIATRFSASKLTRVVTWVAHRVPVSALCMRAC